MSEIIWGQVLFVLASLCNGMMLMMGYDVLRLFRWLLPHDRLWWWLEDTLYWCLAAVPAFCLFFYYNEGVIRWYGLLGILLGAVLYETGISIPVRGWFGKYANGIRRRLKKIRDKYRQSRKNRKRFIRKRKNKGLHKRVK